MRPIRQKGAYFWPLSLPERLSFDSNPVYRRDRILSFGEPEEYLPRDNWLRQFDGRNLDDGLAIGGKIHSMTGATLSAHAVTDAARRALAMHQILATGDPAGETEP